MKIKSLENVVIYVQKNGITATVKKIFKLFLEEYGPSWNRLMDMRRVKLSKILDKNFKSIVRYGPFAGLKLSPNPWWGLSDRASMLLGLYEKDVLEQLTKLPDNYKTFIDLGAADGYYGIGLLVNNTFQKSICYEMSDAGRETIKKNAALNNVADKVEIRGIATKDFYKEILELELKQSVILIDIEGGEFELLDLESFDALRNSILFIEMHDWYFEDGFSKRRTLMDCASKTHNISEIKMGGRDLSLFEELSRFNDNDRWIICSEGRGQMMSWLRFDPKKSAP